MITDPTDPNIRINIAEQLRQLRGGATGPGVKKPVPPAAAPQINIADQLRQIRSRSQQAQAAAPYRNPNLALGAPTVLGVEPETPDAVARANAQAQATGRQFAAVQSPVTTGQSMRAATPDEIRGMTSGDTAAQRNLSQYVPPQQMAAAGVSPAGMKIPPAPSPGQRLLGSAAKGAVEGFVAPFQVMPTSQPSYTPNRLERAAETVGNVGGFIAGPIGNVIFKYAPPVFKGPLAYIARNFETGAVYNMLDTVVNHYHDLTKMPPKQAAQALATSAGVGGTAFAATGLGFELLARGIIAAGPAGLSVFRSMRDAIHPSEAPVPVGSATPERFTPEKTPRPYEQKPAPVHIVLPLRAASEMTIQERAGAARDFWRMAPQMSSETEKQVNGLLSRYIRQSDDAALHEARRLADPGAPTPTPARVVSPSALPAMAERDLMGVIGQHFEGIATDAAKGETHYENLADRAVSRKAGLGRRTGVTRVNRADAGIRTNEQIAAEARRVAMDARARMTQIQTQGLKLPLIPEPASMKPGDLERIGAQIIQVDEALSKSSGGELDLRILSQRPDLPQNAKTYFARLRDVLSSQSQNVGIVSPGSQAANELITAGKKAVNDIYGSIFRDLAPAEAPGIRNLLPTQIRNEAIGNRDVYAVKSDNLWGRTISPTLRSLSRKANEGAVPERLRDAMTWYIDRLGDPEAFDAALSDALVRYPKAQGILDRMNRLTPEEKAYAEQVILEADRARGKALVDEDIIRQARDFHVSHIWERGPGSELPGMFEGKEFPVMGGGKLSPRTRFGNRRVYPTISQGLAAGMIPRTFDVVTINRINDLDMARAIMAKDIREGLKATGAGKWAVSRDKVPSDWIDLGAELRIFRHPIVIEGKAGEPAAIEQHFYVSPEANEGIKFLYEKDPFRSGSMGKSLANLALEYNAFVKSVELNYSFFHDFNLAKVFAFSRPLAALKGMVTTTERGPGVYQKWGPIAQGINAITGMVPELEHLIRKGLTLPESGESGARVWDAYYNDVGGKAKWGWDNEVARARHRALWGTLMPGLKATDTIITVRDALRKFDGFINPRTRLPYTEDEIFEAVSEFGNRKYGGLNWDRRGTTIGTRRIMRALMLAPDWTLSNILLGASAFKGGFHITKPNTMFSNSVEGWAARQSLAKTAATFFGALQAVNYAFTDHTTFQNPEGRWYSIQLPWKTKDGRNLYADWILPGELRDLIRIGAATAGTVYGVAANQQMAPQEGLSGLTSFVAGKGSVLARGALQAASQTKWGGIPLYQPGMTDREKALALLGQFAQGSLPIPIGLSAALSGRDPTQIASTVLGAGAVSQGVLVPASAYQSLPIFNKHEFLDGLPNNLREEFTMQLETGRLTGEPGIRFRRYLDRYQYLRTHRNQSLPVDQRYLPPGKHQKREPIKVGP